MRLILLTALALALVCPDADACGRKHRHRHHGGGSGGCASAGCATCMVPTEATASQLAQGWYRRDTDDGWRYWYSAGVCTGAYRAGQWLAYDEASRRYAEAARPPWDRAGTVTAAK